MIGNRDFMSSSSLTPVNSVQMRLNDFARQDDSNCEVLDGARVDERTTKQKRFYHALYGDGGFSSHERTLNKAPAENRMEVLRAGCIELFKLAAKASVSHVAIADWATLQGQIYGMGDDDLLQSIIVDAQVSAQNKVSVEPTTSNSDTGANQLVMRCMADIQPEKIEWLWPGRIAIGKQTLIGGEPGLGKSQITAALAAAVTTGGEWPCNEGRAPRGSVIILSAEDDASDTIRPRLDAASADVSRVHLISAVRQKDGTGRRSFNLQADLDLLEKAIQRIGDVRLVIIDPVSSYLGKTDSHKNADVRGTLEPLGDMASRLRVAVTSISHFSKGAGQSAVNSFIGSIAFVAAARAAFIVARDPYNEDPARRLFVQAKNNLAVDSGGLAFRVEQRLVGKDIVASAIVWESERIARTADEILVSAREGRDTPERSEAEVFLRDALATGPRPATEVLAEVENAGLSERTVRRALKSVGIKPYRKAESDNGLGKSGRWYWSLPDSTEVPKMAGFPYDGHVSDVATLGDFGNLKGTGGDR
jgi:putative DNA primase/helicase